MKIQRINAYKWEIKKESKYGMNVPGIVFSDHKGIEKIKQDGSINQVINAATLPGAVRASYAMPDVHYGYGFPIGGVLATDFKNGVISPGGVGFDINCGVRLLITPLNKDFLNKYKDQLLDALYGQIPSGIGSRGKLRLNQATMREVITNGSKWAIEQGYGSKDDIENTENDGCMQGASPDAVSKTAYDRGKDQLGTLGSGNHFVEIQVVHEILNVDIARKLGLKKGLITVMIHSGSRGFGHQVCSDFLKIMVKASQKYKINLRDRQLACAPITSKEGRQYLAALKCAANYAWANRQCLMHWVRDVFVDMFTGDINHNDIKLLYDVAHNIVKIEDHIVDGKNRKLAVHRKGATRAFGPGHADLSKKYRITGQPVLIPGDMGTASYVLVGTEKSMHEAFGSACHGAGRTLSRRAAKKAAKNRSIIDELKNRGIAIRASGYRTIVEEMPDAYKPIDDVIKIVTATGLANVVAKMKPIGVIKG